MSSESFHPASISTANAIFNLRPHIKLIAIRDNARCYTIVRRGDIPANFLFNQAPVPLPRINIRELRDRMAMRMGIPPVSQGMTIQEQQQLSDFINQTLTSHHPRPTPLPTDVLNDLDEVRADTLPGVIGDKCPICLDNFVTGDKVILLQCQHTAHSACLRRWFTEKDSCPQCRAIPRMRIRTVDTQSVERGTKEQSDEN